MRVSRVLIAVSLSTSRGALALTWGTTKNLFVFGASYSTTGWNVSAGLLNPPPPRYTSSNGPNWVLSLTQRYNVTNTAVFNLAYPGATTDSALVPPYLPTVLSFVQQVGLWKQYFSPAPAEVPWQSSDSLFAVWMGNNDIGNSWSWTNVSQDALHETLINRLFNQIEILYQSGARSFLFVNVPPLDRAPLYVSQGRANVSRVGLATIDYNLRLSARVSTFIREKNSTNTVRENGALGQVVLFNVHRLFGVLLDNADTLGFVNATGYAQPYISGTPSETQQILPYLPVSDYFWLNTLHPVWPVHDIMAKAIATLLS